MKILAFPLLFFCSALSSNEGTEFSGLYLRYEGAEYESAFIPCHTNEVWWIEGGAAYDELVNIYRASTKNEFGEILVSLELNVERIHKTKYPNSHYDASATVSTVAVVAFDDDTIAACRKEQ